MIAIKEPLVNANIYGRALHFIQSFWRKIWALIDIQNDPLTLILKFNQNVFVTGLSPGNHTFG